MSKRAVLLVSTNPASEAQTDEYNAWYTDVHIPQIVERVPGFVGCTRYVLHDSSPVRPDQRYLAVYEIEADDPGAALEALGAALAAGQLDMSPALKAEPAPTSLFEAL
jgi:hypothetical protein